MRTAPRAVLDVDLTPELDRVTMPVLVLQGGRDTSVRPVLAQDLVAGLPNARYIAYPDSGHMLVLERTESVAREIAAFARSSLG
jgi:pimeloyl-ACP methyl ester carboxylesterase